MIGLDVFATTRLQLRPMGEGDRALYGRLYTDPEVMRHIAPPLSDQEAQIAFEKACRQQSLQRQYWIIVLRRSEQLDSGSSFPRKRESSDFVLNDSKSLDSRFRGNDGNDSDAPLRDDNAAIGLLGLFAKDDAAEIGVMLLPRGQGQGFAAEAIPAMADRAFATQPQLHALWTRHAADNPLATGLMRKLGFTHLADAEAGDKPDEEQRWQLLRTQWQASSEAEYASACYSGDRAN